MQARRLVSWITVWFAISSAGITAQDRRLVEAAKAADTPSVRTLLEKGVDPDIPQPDGATALHWAAHWDDAVMARGLVGAGANVNATNDFGATALWLASLNGSASLVETLLTAGADANATLPSGETVLMTASRTGSATAVRGLVAHGARIDAQEHTRGQTALMWAVAQGHAEVVSALVELGADVHLRSLPRPRRIHTRTAGFNPTGVLDVVQGGFTPLLFAARHGDLDIAKHLIAGGASVHDTALTGTSALVVAAHSGHTAVTRLLLEHGADPNAADAGYTALHVATLRGDEVVARALLAKGANPNTSIERGSPGRRNSPDYVLEHDLVGATPFWLAARFAEPDIMQALVDAGAHPDVVMLDGTTPLMAAVGARRRQEPGLTPNTAEDERLVREAVTVAIEAGTDVDATNTGGNTALHTAAARRLDTVVQILVDSGANLHKENGEGKTPVMMATGRDGDVNSTVELLRRLGAS